jgi:tetratricopeptide (TPR) repeat protein
MIYLEKIILPLRLSAIYPLPRSVHFLSYEILVPVLVSFVLAGGIYYSRRWTREIAFGFLYFLVTLSPALLLFHALSIKAFVTDHNMYLPSVGLFYLFSLGVHRVFEKQIPYRRLKNIALFALLALLTVLYSIAAYRRTLVWKDSEVLALDVIKNYPDAAHAHSMLGSLYAERGLIDQAIAEDTKALELNPYHPQALHILAVMSTLRGLHDEAEALYRQAIGAGRDTMRTHYNLAMIYKQKGRLKEAVSELKWALRMSPQEVRIYNELGSIYTSLGQLEEARAAFKKALGIDSNNRRARDQLEKLALH